MLLRKKYLVAISLVEMGTAGVPEMAFGLLITMAGPSEGKAILGTRGQAEIENIDSMNVEDIANDIGIKHWMKCWVIALA